MNINIKQKYFSVLLVLTFFSLFKNSYTLASNKSEVQAFGGAVTGIITGNYLANLINKEFNKFDCILFLDGNPPIEKYKINAKAVKLLTIGCCAYAGWKLIYRYTSKGKLKRAKKIINSINYDLYEAINYNDDQVIINNIKDLYINSPFPLALAFDNLLTMQSQLIKARRLILDACPNKNIESEINAEWEQHNIVCTKLAYIAKALLILKNIPEFTLEVIAKNNFDTLANQRRMRRQMETQTWINIVNSYPR